MHSAAVHTAVQSCLVQWGASIHANIYTIHADHTTRCARMGNGKHMPEVHALLLMHTGCLGQQNVMHAHMFARAAGRTQPILGSTEMGMIRWHEMVMLYAGSEFLSHVQSTYLPEIIIFRYLHDFPCNIFRQAPRGAIGMHWVGGELQRPTDLLTVSQGHSKAGGTGHCVAISCAAA